MNSEHGIDVDEVSIKQKLMYNGIDIDEVIKMNNDLCCCGNCLHGSDSCPQVKEQELSAFNCCEHWEFDGLTAAERIKG